jgi:hypothetical protein
MVARLQKVPNRAPKRGAALVNDKPLTKKEVGAPSPVSRDELVERWTAKSRPERRVHVEKPKKDRIIGHSRGLPRVQGPVLLSGKGKHECLETLEFVRVPPLCEGSPEPDPQAVSVSNRGPRSGEGRVGGPRADGHDGMSIASREGALWRAHHVLLGWIQSRPRASGSRFSGERRRHLARAPSLRIPPPAVGSFQR